MRRFALLPLLAVVTLAPALADSSQEQQPNESHWRIILKDQLKREKGCELNEVLAFNEMPLGAGIGVDGRVSCFDGRHFDFSRKGTARTFTIEICAPAVC